MARKLIDYAIVTLKGMAMGVAELVPGVSGGTIAFVAGIYEELITSINNVNLSLLKTLKTNGIKSFWEEVNGNFLLALLAGMALSIFSFSKIITWLLVNEPIPLWAFFFGLVLASVIYILKAITKWSFLSIALLIIGAVIAYYITVLPPSGNTDSYAFLFLSGAIAICAMILPGISGSFILVLLGSYKTILGAVDDKDIKILGTVTLGAIFGLLSFAKILKWLFEHYKNLTLATLSGFILGSLNKIWPWKEVIDTYFIGKKEIVIDRNISPLNFEGDPQLFTAIGLAIVGFSLIFILERLAAKK